MQRDNKKNWYRKQRARYYETEYEDKTGSYSRYICRRTEHFRLSNNEIFGPEELAEPCRIILRKRSDTCKIPVDLNYSMWKPVDAKKVSCYAQSSRSSKFSKGIHQQINIKVAQ